MNRYSSHDDKTIGIRGQNLSERGTFELGRELPISQAWQRWELVLGVELHIRNDAARRYGGFVEQLLKLAKSITEC